jgi:anti-sigma regulatory factor (Ser/Thr protein kinase)
LLLVSELVANAVEHGGTQDHINEVELQVIVADDHVQIEVTDHSVVVPVPRGGPVDRPSGRGLALVDRLASRWGVARVASGKTVWMEVAR